MPDGGWVEHTPPTHHIAMRTFALRIATLLLTAAVSVSAGAVTVFDNLAAADDPWLIQHNSAYQTDLWVANRIPISTESLRITQVKMNLTQIDQFELQVCATDASAATPFVDMTACAPFTADAATPGLRVFTGNRVVAAGDFAWVVMRSIGETMIRRQITTATNDGLTWYSSKRYNSAWVAEPQTSIGMTVEAGSVQLDGVCGSASGNTPLRYAPEGASLCSVGAANGVWGEADRFAWRCQGEYGGNPSQCSAPRAYFVTTQATGGGSIASGREVTAGQQASRPAGQLRSHHSAGLHGSGQRLRGRALGQHLYHRAHYRGLHHQRQLHPPTHQRRMRRNGAFTQLAH